MDRRDATVALLASPLLALWAVFFAKNGDWSPPYGPARNYQADPDVPFSGTFDNGDRKITANACTFVHRIGAIRDARTGDEIEHVVRLNWDGPWLDRYEDPDFDYLAREVNDKIIRDHRAFTVELDGRVYRSASL